ncbi:hypothetical protein [Clostridium coskatii]|uniref:Uncharacterized protein n=1 Tax=Clostridium coskatii TaxID=1705578 RepID=A0A166SZU3_9CLOT|nr:hypothetical protein [Clostridium coskatii]OAA93014.1 hypothetical protein WX73_00332 [Clostridium coskatii]OBR90444.1 hypothetical protein CLCOS_40020 [Clostridium coskatii]
MPKDLSAKVDITGTDAFNGFTNILKEVMEDKRVPDEVKHEIMDKINNLINKKEDKSNAKIK